MFGNINEDDDYLGFLHTKKDYIDISSVIQKNGFTLYRIANNIDFKISDVNQIINGLTSKWELYKLVMNLLISKNYAHLILNNPLLSVIYHTAAKSVPG